MKFVPHNYQRYCITRIIQDEALALFLDMGLGKTVIALTAINDLVFNRFLVSRCLIIAPKKVAEDTWTREQSKWDHLRMLKVLPVLGNRNRRVRILNSPGNVWVVSRDNVSWLADYYRNAWPFDMVVVDESSSFKNPRAKRFKSLRNVRCHMKRFVELTGTPAPGGLMDLWSQVYLVDGGMRLGRTLTEYRSRYFTAASRNRTTIFSYEPLPGAEEEIHERIRDVCISLSAEDYLELPPRIDNYRYVKLDQRARRAYEEMEREKVLELPEGMLDAGSAAVLSGKLLQLANGAVYKTAERHENGGVIEDKEIVEIHQNKLEAFLELVEELNGRHALVFYNFRHDLERMKRVLAGSGLRIAELKNPADTAAWNAGQVDLLFAHPASAAYGLNLQQGGSDVIWFGLNYSLELYQQANDRLHRQGQEHKVRVHHLVVEDSVDEDVVKALQKKGDIQEALLDALKARISKYFGQGDGGNGL